MFVNPLLDPSTMTEETLWSKLGDLQKRVLMAHQSGNQQMVGQFQSLIEMFSMELETRQTTKLVKEDEMKSGVWFESDPQLAEAQGLGPNKDPKSNKKPWK